MACMSIRVIPSSSRNQICGWHDKQLKIKVQAPPEDGEANKAVLDLISKTLGVKKSHIRIVSGHTSAQKVVEVIGLSDEELGEMNF